MDDLENSTPPDGQDAATPPAPAPADGTVQPDGQAQAGAPASDGFTNVDPNTLPPQLRNSYNNMLRDYKEKTTRLSETIKAEVAKSTEAFRQKSDLYDQVTSQEEFVNQWNDYVQRSNAAQTQAPSDSGLKEMKDQIQKMDQKLQISEMVEITNAFADATDEKGNPIHPEFDTLNDVTIGHLNGKEPFSLLRACVELAGGATPHEKLLNGFKIAKENYNAIFEAGRKAGLGRVQSKIQGGTLPPSGSNEDLLSVTDKKPKNAREALEMARKGVMVAR